VYCVDPHPTDELRAALAADPALHLVERPSPEVLPDLPVADLYVLDGDHNYAVVRQELGWIVENAPDAVVAMHDVLWPCSRRDLYYEPSPLSSGDKLPSSADGPTVWHDDLTPAGFVGLGAFTSAERAGGERNGVLTAVEDVLAEAADPWQFAVVPAVFGMGVAARRSPVTESLFRDLTPYVNSSLLATMENNRIALYTRVLEQQYEAAARANHTDSLANTIAEQRRDIERLTDELRSANARSAAAPPPDAARPSVTSARLMAAVKTLVARMSGHHRP
jgi:methyltransferase family protein